MVFLKKVPHQRQLIENMMDRTWQFFEHVHATSLSLSTKTLKFFMMDIIFAGSCVGPDSIQVDTTKLTAVIDWRAPPNLLNLSSFLGLTGYFQDLIKGYTKITQPLTDLICGVAVPKGVGKAAYHSAFHHIK